MPRLFTALAIPSLSPVRRMASALRQADSRQRIEPENRWHITLNFLGNVEEQQIPRLVALLSDVTDRAEHLSVSLKGLGAFPDCQHPRVVWVGTEDDEGLRSLQLQLRIAVRNAGLIAEESFHPHLTLARVRGEPTVGLLELLRKHSQTRLAQVPVHEVVLFESRPHPASQIYHARARFPLGGTGKSRG